MLVITLLLILLLTNSNKLLFLISLCPLYKFGYFFNLFYFKIIYFNVQYIDLRLIIIDAVDVRSHMNIVQFDISLLIVRNACLMEIS